MGMKSAAELKKEAEAQRKAAEAVRDDALVGVSD
jgi:hypothetical protein